MLLEVLIPALVPVSASARERTCSLAAATASGRMLSGAPQVRSGKQSSEDVEGCPLSQNASP